MRTYSSILRSVLISEHCYRYDRNLDADNDYVVNWFINLTDKPPQPRILLLQSVFTHRQGFKMYHEVALSNLQAPRV
jgi:hypothetical protein